MVIHSSFADFILFLYVHMSHADDSYDPAEMAAIKAKMASLFPAGTDFEKKLYLTIREYNTVDKSTLDELFRGSLHHFAHDQGVQKSKVYADIREIMSADGKINAFEMKAFEALKQMIDLNIENNT